MSRQRKATYKLPHTVLDGAPQHARRVAALAAQKQARTQQLNAHRTNIDLFASLSLGWDDDGDDEPAQIDKTEGVAKYVHDVQPVGHATTPPKARQPSRWASLCMYAELLEMNEDEAMDMAADASADGIPPDLQEGWIAIAPLPAGKRCLAVSTNANGIGGVRASLRCSALNNLITSSIEAVAQVAIEGPHTLEFPLDAPARHHPRLHTRRELASYRRAADFIRVESVLIRVSIGILHVLDVVRWRGTDDHRVRCART